MFGEPSCIIFTFALYDWKKHKHKNLEKLFIDGLHTYKNKNANAVCDIADGVIFIFIFGGIRLRHGQRIRVYIIYK